MKVSIIIPAYNEESRLAATLDYYYEAIRERYQDAFELIVVANGCRDNTAQVGHLATDRHPQVQVVDITEPIGKGGAVLEGFRRATGQRVLFADADGATSAESLLELLDQLDANDVAIGSRRLSGSIITQAQPLQRRAFSRLFNLSIRCLFNLHYGDTQCGAKAFRHDAAKRLTHVVDETRWAFDVDLLLCARSLDLTVGEHPVVWEDKVGSKLRVGSTVREVMRSLWRMKRRHLQMSQEALLTMAREV